MRLNTVETVLMHNPVRTLIQRHYEAPLLARLGGSVRGFARAGNRMRSWRWH